MLSVAYVYCTVYMYIAHQSATAYFTVHILYKAKLVFLGHNPPTQTKIRLMKVLVWPVATYGCKN